MSDELWFRIASIRRSYYYICCVRYECRVRSRQQTAEQFVTLINSSALYIGQKPGGSTFASFCTFQTKTVSRERHLVAHRQLSSYGYSSHTKDWRLRLQRYRPLLSLPMADHEGNEGGGGIPGFAYAEALGNHFQELSKDANIAVPGVVLVRDSTHDLSLLSRGLFWYSFNGRSCWYCMPLSNMPILAFPLCFLVWGISDITPNLAPSSLSAQASILAFLCIIGLSWVMDGKTTWPSVGESLAAAIIAFVLLMVLLVCLTNGRFLFGWAAFDVSAVIVGRRGGVESSVTMLRTYLTMNYQCFFQRPLGGSLCASTCEIHFFILRSGVNFTGESPIPSRTTVQ